MDDLTKNNYAGDDLRLSGIGGWLAILAIGMIVSGLVILSTILQSHIPMFQDGTLPAMYNYNKAIFGILIFQAVSDISLFVFIVYLCILLFKKSKRFPKLMFTYMIVNCAIVIINCILVIQLVKPIFDVTLPNVIQPILYTAIWGTYLKKSRRVSNTFVF